MIRFGLASVALACAACGGTVVEGGGGSNGGATSIFGSGSGGAPIGRSAKCKLNSDCNIGLVCAFGECHAECASSRDCPAPQRCVVTGSTNVCQLRQEAVCVYRSDCKLPLTCAADLQCRSQCANDPDCPSGQHCTFGVCADPSEVNPTTGALLAATDAGAAFPGGPGR